MKLRSLFTNAESSSALELRRFVALAIVTLGLALLDNAGAAVASTSSGTDSSTTPIAQECHCRLDYKLGPDVWVGSCVGFRTDSPYCCSEFDALGDCTDPGSDGDYLFGCRCSCSKTYTYTPTDSCGNPGEPVEKTDTWTTLAVCITPESTSGIDLGPDADELPTEARP